MVNNKVFSSIRVHIEGKPKCGFEGFEEIGENHNHRFMEHKGEKFEAFNNERREHECECEDFFVEKGFDGKKDRVVIEVKIDCELDEQTFHTLILAQPCPSDGFNLPVFVRFHFCDTGKKELVRMIRGLEPWRAVGDLEYGQDLPTCRNRMPVYFTNGRELVDLRRRCCDL